MAQKICRYTSVIVSEQRLVLVLILIEDANNADIDVDEIT